MTSWFYLATAIVAEVFGSSALKLSDGLSKSIPTLGVVLGYGLAFYLLSLTLKQLPLGLSYAIWSGLGTAGAVLVGATLFQEVITPWKLFALALILCSVLLLYLLPSSSP